MDNSSSILNYFIFIWAVFVFCDISNCIPVTESSTPPLPPLLFPQDPQIYRIVPPNETALKILQNSEKTVKTSLFPRERLFLDDPRREIFKINNNMHVDDIPEVFPSEYSANLKSEVEEIQPEDKTRPKIELEEQFRSISANLHATNQIFPDEDIETHPIKLHHGHITAILIAGICIISFIIYAVLVSWRTYLEKRYGMRERLVTHDDYCINDSNLISSEIKISNEIHN